MLARDRDSGDRMNRIVVAAICLLAWSAAAFAATAAQGTGSLVGVDETGTSSGNQVIRIDPTTGARTVVAMVPNGQSSLLNGIATIDTAGRRYFLITVEGGIRRLLAVNVQTGAILANPVLGYNAAFIQYDPTTDRLIGEQESGTSSGNLIVSIDPVTGSPTTVAAVPNGQAALLNGIAAIDVAGRRYFMITVGAGGQRLLVVDIQTGAILANPVLGYNGAFLQYDSVNNTLVGIEESGSSSGNRVIRIDPTSGVRTVIGTVPDGQSVLLNGLSAIDVAGQRYFVVTLLSGIHCLLAVSLQTGTVIANPGLGYNGALLTFDPNQPFSAASSVPCAAPPTATPTSTSTPTATGTATPTSTATVTGTPPTPTVTSTSTPTGTPPTLTPTSTPTPTVTPTLLTLNPPDTRGSRDSDSDKNGRDRETETRRLQREHTNQAGLDDYRTEGNVLGTRCDLSQTLPTGQAGTPSLPDDVPYVLIGTRDGVQQIHLHGPAAPECPSIRPGDYLQAEGEKQSEQFFDATDLSVESRR